MLKPTKKPTACRPCHERKVRCDASISGLPCTRCITRNEVDQCHLIKTRRPTRARGPSHAQGVRPVHRGIASLIDTTNDVREGNSTVNASYSFAARTANNSIHAVQRSDHSVAKTLSAHVGTRRPIDPETLDPQLNLNQQSTPSSPQQNNNADGVPEEDAQLQMYSNLTGDVLIRSPTCSANCSSDGCEIIEYQNELDHLSILCEAAARSRKPKLVRIVIRGSSMDQGSSDEASAHPNSGTTCPSEYRGLAEAELTYLAAKSVFDLPSDQIRQQFLNTYFEVVYPYAPVLDKAEFSKRCASSNPPVMLLHAMIANTIPYVPLELITTLSFHSRTAAMKSFNSRAILLYDFSSDRPRSQLELLQVSLLLGTLQFSLTADKDFRFWLHNAVRIATRMGLHKNDIASDLKPSELKLWRRMWWILYVCQLPGPELLTERKLTELQTRDIQLTLAGLQSFPLLGSIDCQIPDLTEEDWDEALLQPPYPDCPAPTTRVQKLYQIEMCKLAKTGSSVLRALQCTGNDREAARLLFDAAETIPAQRNNCPRELSLTGASLDWNTDYLWASLFCGYSYRVECIVYWELCRLYTSLDQSLVDSLRKRHQGSVFELDTMFGRILMWDAVKYFPLGFIMIVSMVLASHIQLTVKIHRDQSKNTLSRIYIPQGLEFLRKAQENWDCIAWKVRLFERILEQYTNAGIETGYRIPTQKSSGTRNGLDPLMNIDSSASSLYRADNVDADTETAMTFDGVDADLDTWLGAMARGDEQDSWLTEGLTDSGLQWN